MVVSKFYRSIIGKAINESIKDSQTLILDFKGIDYISSAGLRVLLVAFNTMNKQQGKMIVRHPNSNVMNIFTMTGFDGILVIENKDVFYLM